MATMIHAFSVRCIFYLCHVVVYMHAAQANARTRARFAEDSDLRERVLSSLREWWLASCPDQ